MVRICFCIGQREDQEKLMSSYPSNPVVFSRVIASSKLRVGNLCVVLLKRIDEELRDLIWRSHIGRFVCQTLPHNCLICFILWDGVAPAIVFLSVVFFSSAHKCWVALGSLKTFTEGPCVGFPWTRIALFSAQIFQQLICISKIENENIISYFMWEMCTLLNW